MGNTALINNAPRIRRVLIYTLILNSAVSVAKIIYGYISNSIAMTSDGFHSLFDGISNIIGLAGIWIASHPPDERHPYGHKKYETLFTVIIAVMIFAACFQIIRQVYHSIVEHSKTEVTTASFVVMLATMCVNIFVAGYESRKGKELKSEFILADALHTKSDILASLAVIASLVLTKAGYRFADAIVGVMITFFIARIGFQIIKKASDVFVDTVCIDTPAVEAVIKSVEGVKGCHDIRTRGTEHAVSLDVHVLVDPAMSIKKAHRIADAVEEKIKNAFPDVIDIVVHIEPDGND